MKCLITGAAGYIGSNLISKLSNQGYELYGLIHLKKPKKEFRNVRFFQGDISKESFISNIPKDFDLVIHCASLVYDYGPKKRFYEVNFHGTKNLVDLSKKSNVNQFIYIGHINYESNNFFNYYSETKAKAQEYLINEFKENKFPVTIICPGNVYGPGATIWLVRILNIILKNQLYLIDHGNGIFHHTYIDNLIDAIILTIKKPSSVGQLFNITDWDNSVTFQKYFSDLAEILEVNNSFKNISKKTALKIGIFMILLNKISGIKPIISPLAVEIMTNQMSINIESSSEILNYKPKINYKQAMNNIKNWIIEEYF